MNAALPFQQFQHDFGRHLRDPQGRHRPAGVPARRANAYRELLRNNLEGFLLACFPISRELLGPRRWQGLLARFFRDGRCRTPYFREIPCEFLRWLSVADPLPVALPPWALELAHYEWVELALDVMDDATPARMNLAYAWPVHRIGPGYRPRKARATYLLVYRDRQDRVQFIELNAVSSRFINLLQAGHATPTAARMIAAELAYPQADAVIAHGEQLLAQLQDAGVDLRGLSHAE